MFRLRLLTLVVAGFASGATAAESLTIPHGGRIVTVTVPDGQAPGLAARDAVRELVLDAQTSVTRELLVQLHGRDPGAIATRLGLEDLGTGPASSWRFRAASPAAAAEAAMDLHREQPGSAEVVLRQARSLRGPDPLFTEQWNLFDAPNGISVTGAWAVTTGTGVRISVVDSGVQSTHPDLAGQVETANGVSYQGGNTEPPTSLEGSYHGTFCAGLIGAVADNDLGIAGIANGGTIVPVRLLGGASPTTADEAGSQLVQVDATSGSVAVSNNSWGPADNGMFNGLAEVPSTTLQNAWEQGTTTARGGKGVVYVWAAGNGSASPDFDAADWDGYASDRRVMAIGATNKDGLKAPYSEIGACVFLCAPVDFTNVDGIPSTDLAGADGNSDGVVAIGSDTTGDYTRSVGTSFAAPQVAGVAALCLAANPSLSWRDVRRILAYSGKQNDAANAADPTWPWITTGAGLVWSQQYGFGLVDAKTAVEVAAGIGPFTLPTPALLPERTPPITASISGTAYIPDNQGVTGAAATATLPITAESTFRIETVQATIGWTHPSQYELLVSLTSPSGTRIDVPRRPNDTAAARTWTFTFVGFLDEPVAGTWTLEVRDRRSGNLGVLQSVALRIDGYQVDGSLTTAGAVTGASLVGGPIPPSTGGGGGSASSSGSSGGGCGAGTALGLVVLLGLRSLGKKRRRPST